MASEAGSELLHILLVEDNPGDVRLTEVALREGTVAGELSVVADGEQALAFLRREGDHADAPRPDVILLDLNLPRRDGREVLSEIKSDPELRDIPVVILTVSQADADIDHTLDLSASSYIIKPVDAEQLQGVLGMLGKGEQDAQDAQDAAEDASD